jgi:hypothetical protein
LMSFHSKNTWNPDSDSERFDSAKKRTVTVGHPMTFEFPSSQRCPSVDVTLQKAHSGTVRCFSVC